MAIVKKYPTRVLAIHNHIEGVYTLELESMSNPFKYRPGQFLHFALDEYDFSEQWPESRCFSMQSSPCEEVIKITYAVKGTFTTRMQQELKPGKQVTLKLPYGDLFTQQHNKVNTVFIAGGTGITPYLSLFTDFSFASYINPCLFAGFRSMKLNLYAKELIIAKQINVNLDDTYTYQDSQGILDIKFILEQSDRSTSFFISGPPIMIKNFKSFLLEHGILRFQIKTDDWE